jgi:hypothetical protein
LEIAIEPSDLRVIGISISVKRENGNVDHGQDKEKPTQSFGHHQEQSGPQSNLLLNPSDSNKFIIVVFLFTLLCRSPLAASTTARE